MVSLEVLVALEYEYQMPANNGQTINTQSVITHAHCTKSLSACVGHPWVFQLDMSLSLLSNA